MVSTPERATLMRLIRDHERRLRELESRPPVTTPAARLPAEPSPAQPSTQEEPL